MEDTIYRIIKLYGEEYKWKCAIFWSYITGEEKSIFSYVTSWYDKGLKGSKFIRLSKQASFGIGEGLIGDVIKSRKYRWIQNISKAEKYRRKDVAMRTGINSIYVAPIVSGKEVLGAIEFLGNKKHFPVDFASTLQTGINQIYLYLKRKESEIQLAKSEEKSQTISELAPAIIYTANEKGLITSLNPAVESITGLKSNDLIGKPVLELFCPDNRDEVATAYKTQRDNNNLVSFEASIVTNKNEDLIAEVKEKTRYLSTGEIERIGIIRDVTERYFLEKQKDLWMGIATHELKTPLSSIKAFSQILTKKGKNIKPKERQNYLLRINKLADEMTGLIQDLLDITKIRTGSLEISSEKCNINELINEVVEEMLPVTNHKVIFKKDEKVYINCDRRRIEQVIINLLSNAIKYSPAGSKIIIKTENKKDTVALSVQDFGKGIEDKNKKHVFELFYRGESKNNSSFGLGLGLYISRAIVNAHNGNIWVESKVDEGSTFFVELPKK